MVNDLNELALEPLEQYINLILQLKSGIIMPY